MFFWDVKYHGNISFSFTTFLCIMSGYPSVVIFKDFNIGLISEELHVVENWEI